MKTYHIITIGCQMNKSDSERVAGYLENLGYKWSDNKYQADLVAVNTCGVRQSAEDRAYGIIPRIKKANPKVKIILTGCLSERKDVQRRLKDKVDLWLPIVDLPKLSNFINFINPCYTSPLTPLLPALSDGVKIRREELKGGGESDYLNLQPKYSSAFSAFVPIGNGCDNFCAYCVVPRARGREVYRPAEDILSEVENLVKKGYKEIILIAQNVNSYKVESKKFKVKNNEKFGINFTQLLKLVNNIQGDFWIRFATSHPKDMSDELIKIVAKCDKICEHVHLPAQSGDNEILKKMNRNYTIEHYKKLISRIKCLALALSLLRRGSRSGAKTGEEPPVAITTDIIVGFPGETKRQFNNTVKLFKEVKFDMAYISQYSQRPGTAAEKLNDDVPKEEKKRREQELMAVLRKTALENNKKYVGKVVSVLVEGRNKRGEWYGKTRTGKNVKITDNRPARLPCSTRRAWRQITDLVGEFMKVKINKVRDFGLEGELVM